MLERVVVGIATDTAQTIEQINRSDPRFSDRDLYHLRWPKTQDGCQSNPARLGIMQKGVKMLWKAVWEELAKAQEGIFRRSAICRPPGPDKNLSRK